MGYRKTVRKDLAQENSGCYELLRSNRACHWDSVFVVLVLVGGAEREVGRLQHWKSACCPCCPSYRGAVALWTLDLIKRLALFDEKRATWMRNAECRVVPDRGGEFLSTSRLDDNWSFFVAAATTMGQWEVRPFGDTAMMTN